MSSRCIADATEKRLHSASEIAPRHRAHTISELTMDYVAQFERPIGIGRVVVVETLGPLDVASIAKEIDRNFLRNPT